MLWYATGIFVVAKLARLAKAKYEPFKATTAQRASTAAQLLSIQMLPEL